MEASRFRTPFRNMASLSYLLQRLRNFSSSSLSSSSSSSAAASPRRWKFFSDDPLETGSPVYNHALKFQRPSTIKLFKWRRKLYNSVSFIGTVDRPVEKFNTTTGFYACTSLSVKASPNSNRYLRIFLKMWNDMAEVSVKHLKPDDFIYVSGRLQSYTKTDDDGKQKMFYEVIVHELNYVAERGRGLTFKKSKKTASEDSGESPLEKNKRRLHLWQVFFANPSEWLDCRRSKVNPDHPDFKNKHTGEALWFSHRDPPWIKRQLQLHDSRLAARDYTEDVSPCSSLSPWI